MRIRKLTLEQTNKLLKIAKLVASFMQEVPVENTIKSALSDMRNENYNNISPEEKVKIVFKALEMMLLVEDSRAEDVDDCDCPACVERREIMKKSGMPDGIIKVSTEDELMFALKKMGETGDIVALDVTGIYKEQLNKKRNKSISTDELKDNIKNSK